jgi:hypothetical protein
VSIRIINDEARNYVKKLFDDFLSEYDIKTKEKIKSGDLVLYQNEK